MHVTLEIDFIIGGYTIKLQMMDVRLNHPFKHKYQHEFTAFMVTSTMGSLINRMLQNALGKLDRQ